jgi:hypothetical protein
MVAVPAAKLLSVDTDADAERVLPSVKVNPKPVAIEKVNSAVPSGDTVAVPVTVGWTTPNEPTAEPLKAMEILCEDA